jgi:hypothetical protein
VEDELERAERFQRMFVTPLVDAVRAEVKPVVDGHERLSRRVAKLETNQKRALWGLSAIASVVSVAVGIGFDWLKRKFGLGH